MNIDKCTDHEVHSLISSVSEWGPEHPDIDEYASLNFSIQYEPECYSKEFLAAGMAELRRIAKDIVAHYSMLKSCDDDNCVLRNSLIQDGADILLWSQVIAGYEGMMRRHAEGIFPPKTT